MKESKQTEREVNVYLWLCTLIGHRQVRVTSVKGVMYWTVVWIVVAAEVCGTDGLDQYEEEVHQVANEHEPHCTQLCQAWRGGWKRRK